MGIFRLLTFSILSLGLIEFSCKSKKKPIAPTVSDNKENTAPKYTKTDLEKWPTPYWSARAKVNVQHPDMNVSFNLTMRADQNRALWFSANAFGIMEVARGLITRDSIFALDKINNRLYSGGLHGLAHYIPVPMGINELQHFMMGRVFWDSLVVARYQQKGDSAYITGEQRDMAFSSAIWLKYFLHSASISKPANGLQIQILNSAFKPNQGTQIAFKKTLKSIQSDHQKTAVSVLEFDFSKFDFVENMPEMPFEIPKDAERHVLR